MREQDRLLFRGIPSEEMWKVACAWMRSARLSWLARWGYRFDVSVGWGLMDWVNVALYAIADPVLLAVHTQHGHRWRDYRPGMPEFRDDTEVTITVALIGWDKDGRWRQVGDSVGRVKLDHWDKWAAGCAQCLTQAADYLRRDRELIPRRVAALENLLGITEHDLEGLAVPVEGLVSVPRPRDPLLANPAITLKGEQCVAPEAFSTATMWAKELWESFLARSAFFDIAVEGKWVPATMVAVRIKADCPGRMRLRIHWIEGDRHGKSLVEVASKGDPPYERDTYLYVEQRGEWEDAARRLVTARGEDFLRWLQLDVERLEALIQKAQEPSSEG